MATVEQQAIKLMAEEVVRAIKKLTEENNKNYVNNQLKNIGISSAGGSGGTVSGQINASQINGLNSAIAGFISGAPGNAENGDINAGLVVNTISGLAAIEVESATIDTAQIQNLYATVADFIYMSASNAEIGDLEAQKIVSAIAELGLVNIDQADIGWGQIKDLTTDSAIIREGVGGKLYIDKLAVTDANMVSLTVGELIVKGEDGNFYAVTVDQDGNVSTEIKKVEGDNIADSTIEGGKLIENTITARELNVSKIFADEALVGAIKAANLDVSDLFANNAFISKLETYIITSPTIGENIDISSNSSITLTNKRLSLMVESESGSTELILTDEMMQAIADKFSLIANEIDLSANESITLGINKTVKEIVEYQAGYRLEIISTSDVLSSDIKSTTLAARVWNGRDNITDELDASLFNWKRTSVDTVGDAMWNSTHKGLKSITLSTLDVYYSATYTCELTDESTAILGEAVLGKMVIGN